MWKDTKQFQKLVNFLEKEEKKLGENGFFDLDCDSVKLKKQAETTLQRYMKFGNQIDLLSNPEEDWYLLLMGQLAMLRWGIHLVYPHDFRGEGMITVENVQKNLDEIMERFEEHMFDTIVEGSAMRVIFAELCLALFPYSEGFEFRWAEDMVEMKQSINTAMALAATASAGMPDVSNISDIAGFLTSILSKKPVKPKDPEATSYFKYCVLQCDLMDHASALDIFLYWKYHDVDLFWDGEYGTLPEAYRPYLPVVRWREDVLAEGSEDTAEDKIHGFDPALSSADMEALESLLLASQPREMMGICSPSMRVRKRALCFDATSSLTQAEARQLAMDTKDSLEQTMEEEKMENQIRDLQEILAEKQQKILPDLEERCSRLDVPATRGDIIDSLLEEGSWDSAVKKAGEFATVTYMLTDMMCHMQSMMPMMFDDVSDLQEQMRSTMGTDNLGHLGIEGLFCQALEQELGRVVCSSIPAVEGSVFHQEAVASWGDIYWKSLLPETEMDILSFFQKTFYPLRLKISKEWASFRFQENQLSYCLFHKMSQKIVEAAMVLGDNKGFLDVGFAHEKCYGSDYFTVTVSFQVSPLAQLSAVAVLEDFFRDTAQAYHVEKGLAGQESQEFYQSKLKNNLYQGKFYMEERLFLTKEGR